MCVHFFSQYHFNLRYLLWHSVSGYTKPRLGSMQMRFMILWWFNMCGFHPRTSYCITERYWWHIWVRDGVILSRTLPVLRPDHKFNFFVILTPIWLFFNCWCLLACLLVCGDIIDFFLSENLAGIKSNYFKSLKMYPNNSK